MDSVRNFCLSLLLSGLSCLPASFAQAEVILYTDNKDFRDVLIKADLPSGSLISDTLRYVFARLEQFPSVQLYNQARAELALTETTPSCLAMKIRTPEREQQYLFSGATDLYLSHRLYINNSLLDEVTPHLSAERQVESLSELIKKFSDSTLLLINNHSYGHYLDSEIEQIAESQRYYLYSTDPYSSYRQMVNKQRTAFALLYPAVESQLSTNAYSSFSFRHNPPLVSGHLMCNQDPQSQAFIDGVDAVLAQMFRTNEFEKFAQKYFPANEMPLIRQFIQSELAALEAKNQKTIRE